MSKCETQQGGVDWNRTIWDKHEVWRDANGGEAWSSYPSVPKIDGEVLTTSRDMWDRFLLPLITPHIVSKPHILEIAPGFGRCTQYLLEICSKLTTVDLSETCIAHCTEKFGHDSRVVCHVNDGFSLNMIKTASVDFIFSWDSFVHINKDVTERYVVEFARVLNFDGVGFIHHSNAGALNQEGQLGLRSDMTAELMADFCKANRLRVISQKLHYPLEGGGFNDCVTIFGQKQAT